MLSPCGDFALGFLDKFAKVSRIPFVLFPFEVTEKPLISPRKSNTTMCISSSVPL